MIHSPATFSVSSWRTTERRQAVSDTQSIQPVPGLFFSFFPPQLDVTGRRPAGGAQEALMRRCEDHVSWLFTHSQLYWPHSGGQSLCSCLFPQSYSLSQSTACSGGQWRSCRTLEYCRRNNKPQLLTKKKHNNTCIWQSNLHATQKKQTSYTGSDASSFLQSETESSFRKVYWS